MTRHPNTVLLAEIAATVALFFGPLLLAAGDVLQRAG
jgi:hypothetical protein